MLIKLRVYQVQKHGSHCEAPAHSVIRDRFIVGPTTSLSCAATTAGLLLVLLYMADNTAASAQGKAGNSTWRRTSWHQRSDITAEQLLLGGTRAAPQLNPYSLVMMRSLLVVMASSGPSIYCPAARVDFYSAVRWLTAQLYCRTGCAASFAVVRPTLASTVHRHSFQHQKYPIGWCNLVQLPACCLQQCVELLLVALLGISE